MKRYLLFTLTALFFLHSHSQQPLNSFNEVLEKIELSDFEGGKIHKFWLRLGQDNFSNPIKVPVLLAKGKSDGKVLGLTAAIHGNELNGIAIIHELFDDIDPQTLQGTVIAIPGLNPLAIENNKRVFIDGVDLNRIFPGKEKGNRSEQIVFKIGQKIIPLFDYHIDLHTASFGRVNSNYGRGDMEDDILANMLRALNPDIIVSNKGKASFGSAAGLTLRAFANSIGVKSITVEYGNPQVYQEDMVRRGVNGIKDLLANLGISPGGIQVPEAKNVCSKSYWMYTDKGGYLDVQVDLNQELVKDEVVAVLRNPLGEVIATYKAPEAGIVIGKSTNPVNISGGRIIHLGILK